MKSPKLWLSWLAVNVCRLLLALTFIFSGTVKLIDPRGFEYKLEDYATEFSLRSLMPLFVPLALAVALSMLEFVLGVNLLFGIRRRLSSWLVLLFMLVVTPLTLYIAVTGTIVDCGCFGDAVVLTNWQTFWKNVVLLAAAIVVVWRGRLMTRFISEHNQWTIASYAVVFSLALALYSVWRLPVIDFRPYHVGVDLAQAIEDEWNSPELEPVYADFSIDTEDRGDITLEWLSQAGYKFLLIAPQLEEADDSAIDDLNNIYDYSQQHGYPFLCLTASSEEAQELWTSMTGAEYPFAFTDAVCLKTVIRSNPGLLLLSDGVIVRKWPNSHLPHYEEDVTPPLEELNVAQPAERSYTKGGLRLLLWFCLPFLVIAALDRMWVALKMCISNYKSNNKTKRTMRKKIVAGNWKMNLSLQEGMALASELKSVLAQDKPNCDVVICTPFVHLAAVAPVVEGTVIGLGAQNCADKPKGAYTGEVSASQVKSTGAQYVILGHSERRAYYHETAAILKEKVLLALDNGLKVIFCIGEVLEEREAGKQNEVVEGQLKDSLFDLTAEQLSHVVLAYEPVWAIGTGKTATAEQAEDMHAFIRKTMAEHFGAEAAENLSILYGGSCKPSNAKEIFSKPDVDGGLIGGASLVCADFKGIIDAWK